MNDTIIAPITPVVTAPVITVRISGPDALKVFSAMETAKGGKPAPVPNMMKRYIFRAENGAVLDDVLAVYFKAPHSYTGEDVVEISFHGNPIIVTSALAALYDMGIRCAEPGEFSKRAFLNGKIDLTQAEAVQELIAAKTESGLHLAYGQLNGAVRYKLDEMKNRLLDVKAIIEAKIDFPEEDTGGDNEPEILESINGVLEESKSLLLAYRSLRNHRNGITIVIAGKPNVGKSSLLNALLKEERAIVSNVPGTTRDYIKEELHLGSIPVQIVDTAGMRDADDDIEAQGVKRSESKIKSADVVLVVLDLSGVIDSDDAKVLEMTEGCNRIIIGNKSDEYKPTAFIPADIIVSAARGHNIDKLIEMIKEKAGMTDSDKISGVVSVTERHAYGLRLIVEVLNSVISEFVNKPLDMTAIDLDQCVSQFEEITGERYTEDILDRIFSKFCIGK